MNEELKIVIKADASDAKKDIASVKKELSGVDSQAGEANSSIKAALSTAAKGAAAAVAAITALTAAMSGLAKSAQDVEKGFSKLKTTFASFGSSTKQATSTYKDLFGFLGDHDKAIETAQSLALITTNTKDLAEWTNILQGAYSSMGDKLPIEGLAEAANETIKVGQVTGVLADALNWMGVSEDAFNASLAQTTSLEEREALVRSTLNSLYGSAGKLYAANNAQTIAYNQSQANLNVALSQASAYLTPLLTSLNNLSTTMLTSFAPAIQLVSIYLTAFIQLLAEAVAWVGGFFGVVSATTDKAAANTQGYQEAMRKYNEELSNSFNRTQDDIAKTGKDIDKLKKQTMGFDELNIVKSQDSTAASGGAGSGGAIKLPEMPKPEDYGIVAPDLTEYTDAIIETKEHIKELGIVLGAVFSLLGIKKLAKFITSLKGASKLAAEGAAAGAPFYKKLFGEKAAKWLDDIAAKIGVIFSKLKTGLGLAGIIEGVFLLIDGVADLISGGYSLTGVLESLGGVGLVITGIFLLFGIAIGSTAGIVLLVIAAIALLVAGFVILWNECEGFRNFWIELWEKIKVLFAKFVESIQPLIDAIVEAFKAAWELIKVIWHDYLVPLFKATWEAIKAVWNEVKPYFAMIWENIKVIFSVVKEVLGAYFKAAWEVIKAVWDVVVSYFTAIWNTIKGVFSVVKNVLSGNFKEAWEAIKGIFSAWGSYFQTLWDSVKKIFSSVKTFFKTAFGAAWDGIKKIFNNVSTFFTGVWDKIKSIFSKVGSTIADAITNTVKKAINSVLSTAVKIINGFISAINFAIDVINAIPGVSISRLSKLSVPQLAKGGIVDSATLAVIGERGKEAVVPLENNTEWMDKLADRIAARSNTQSKIVLKLNDRELGWATIDAINKITTQTGGLQLAL